MKNVLVVIAMEGEAEPFIEHLALSPVFIEAKFPTTCLFHSVSLLLLLLTFLLFLIVLISLLMIGRVSGYEDYSGNEWEMLSF